MTSIVAIQETEMDQCGSVALRLALTSCAVMLTVLLVWPQIACAHGVHGQIAPIGNEPYIPPPSAGWWGIVYGMIQHHVRAMLDMVRKGDQVGPIVSVIALAFGYGILHALGPGHGKFLLASYMTATGAPAGIGIAIALAAALVQGLIAIAIVLVLAVGLEGLADFIPVLQGYVNAASLILLAVLGGVIVLRQLSAFDWLPRGMARIIPMSTCACCSHAAPGPHSRVGEAVRATKSWMSTTAVNWFASATQDGNATRDSRSGFAEAATLAISMGARPCTSAFAILLLALGQDLLGLGIAATIVMSFGVAVTLALIAVLSIDLRERASTVRHAWLPNNVLGILSLGAGSLLTLVAVLGLVGSAA